jgi:hypothetical protein
MRLSLPFREVFRKVGARFVCATRQRVMENVTSITLGLADTRHQLAEPSGPRVRRQRRGVE